MAWLTLIGTLTGTIVGITSTLIADRIRWHRDVNQNWMNIKRELYVSYVCALSDGSAALRKIMRESKNGEADLEFKLHNALLPTGAWRLLHNLAMIAPNEVIAKAQAAQLALHVARDVLIEVSDLGDYRYLEARKDLLAAIHELRSAMRTDLGLSSVANELDRPMW